MPRPRPPATIGSELEARGAENRLRAVSKPNERLALPVVVGGPDHERRLLVEGATGPAVLRLEPAPIPDERVLLPFPADRRLVRVPGEHADFMRQRHEDVHDRAADLLRRTAADCIAEERV